MKKIWISLLNTDHYIRNDIKVRKHGMIIDELKKQGKALLDARRDNFVRQSLLSDEFLNFMQQNKKPFDLLMSYYECAIMEIETKFRVLNHELSLEYDNNPRNNEEAVGKVAESIRQFGFKVPILIDQNNIIIAGHTRKLAAEELGLTQIPCICVEDLSEQQVKEIGRAHV